MSCACVYFYNIIINIVICNRRRRLRTSSLRGVNISSDFYEINNLATSLIM